METKTKTKVAIIIIAIVAITLFLAFRYVPLGERAKFVGTWKSDNGYFEYTYFSDGACLINGEQGTWWIDDGKITVELEDGRITNTNEYFFSNNDRTLTIAGVTFTKQSI